MNAWARFIVGSQSWLPALRWVGVSVYALSGVLAVLEGSPGDVVLSGLLSVGTWWALGWLHREAGVIARELEREQRRETWAALWREHGGGDRP